MSAFKQYVVEHQDNDDFPVYGVFGTTEQAAAFGELLESGSYVIHEVLCPRSIRDEIAKKLAAYDAATPKEDAS